MNKISLLFNDVHVSEHQQYQSDLILQLIGSKKYQKSKFMDRSMDPLYQFQYILGNGKIIGVEILEHINNHVNYQNQFRLYRGRHMAFSFVTSDPETYDRNTQLLRYYYQNVDRYALDSTELQVLIGHTSPENHCKSQQFVKTLEDEIIELDPYNKPIQIPLYFNDSPTAHLFTDLFYATIEHIAMDRNQFFKNIDVQIVYNHNTDLNRDLNGIYQVKDKTHPNETQFFGVFRNKYLRQEILKWIPIIHKELGYHQSELRKIHQLSLYYMLHNNYINTLIDILSNQKELVPELYCNEKFLEILFLFYSNHEDVLVLYIDRFTEYCENHLPAIIFYLCDKASVNIFKYIFGKFKEYKFRVDDVQQAINGKNKNLIKFILKDCKFMSQFHEDRKKIRDILLKHCFNADIKKTITKYSSENRSFLSKIFK
ncbi:hypothetical protein DLAC_05494 [Tieghemostelium lacteum]|uniref:Uncharacterized protein n=1 Tax=Tieghemostelium lacteum TaxID=361077 RepID=A0A151ZGB4_TIELA|nr:hypothetical protein DLAC_05494 [Tieghemostelium lacteum]|eukprot:KYQ92904.1 hypothetical protein DLAC_05494 [Tieghemostelium lacteum]